MVISRAPVRISFGGGGTDLEAYYARFGGFVLSTAIDRYCYVEATEPSDGGIHIYAAEPPGFDAHAVGFLPAVEGALALPAAAIELFAQRGLAQRGVRLALSSDVPSGTGLGSSSAMAVALIHGLAGYLGISLNPATVADLACRLEIERLQMPIGKQDQYASAFGGLNTIEFTTTEVRVTPLDLPVRIQRELRARLLLFSTGQRHNSSAILNRQRNDSLRKSSVAGRLHRIKTYGLAMRDALLAADLDGFGALLDRAWREKRQLTSDISNASIDTWYAEARRAGALGGKITGAGGGGFLLLYTPPERAGDVRLAMERCGLRELPFDFDHDGVCTLDCLPHRDGERLPRKSDTGRFHIARRVDAGMAGCGEWRRVTLPPVEGGVSHA